MAVNAVNGSSVSYIELKEKNDAEIRQQQDVQIFPQQNAVNSEEIPQEESSQKVSFMEGLSLIGKGFVQKLKNMTSAIINHPVKTILGIGATTALIACSPIIGISSATMGSFLALGFGAYAVVKTAFDAVETIKDNNEGRYDEVRQDLQEIGGDGVDLALSLPFAPKAVKQVTRFAKYGTDTLGLNTELISNLSHCRSLNSIQLELAKADTIINYNMIANEMGFAVKPELEFVNRSTNTKQNVKICAEYEPTTGKILVEEEMLQPKVLLALKSKNETMETLLRHELEHYRQFSQIARAQGSEGVKQALMEYYSQAYKANGGTFDVLTNEQLKAKLDEYRILDSDSIETCNQKIELSNGVLDLQEYNLEKQELALNSLELNKDIVKNMLFGDGSMFNKELYENIIKSQGEISANTSEALKAQEYIQGLINKTSVDENLVEQLMQKYDLKTGIEGITERAFSPKKYTDFEIELYKSNILEKEAFAVQDLYKTQIQSMRPDMLSDDVMALAVSEEYFCEDDKNLFEVSPLSETINKDNEDILKYAPLSRALFEYLNSLKE